MGVLASKKLRSGQGKMRDRRYTMRRGPLVIYKENNGIARAFRAIPGVELCSVDRMNLLKANALKNRSVMAKLNPGAAQRQKMRALSMKEGTKERKALLEKKRATAADAKKHSKGAKEFYKNMMAAYEVKAADAEDEE